MGCGHEPHDHWKVSGQPKQESDGKGKRELRPTSRIRAPLETAYHETWIYAVGVDRGKAIGGERRKTRSVLTVRHLLRNMPQSEQFTKPFRKQGEKMNSAIATAAGTALFFTAQGVLLPSPIEDEEHGEDGREDSNRQDEVLSEHKRNINHQQNRTPTERTKQALRDERLRYV